MLTFEQKLEVLQSFPELERKNVSLGRVNFHYEDSAYDKKTVVYHLHPNGNGFVYAGNLQGVRTDDKGFVNIREYSAEELRSIVEASIRSLSPNGSVDEPPSSGASAPERWINEEQEVLTVHYEDELWYIYAGSSLESACETYEEVEEYMLEEGFAKA